jgi:hypothetical protein
MDIELAGIQWQKTEDSLVWGGFGAFSYYLKADLPISTENPYTLCFHLYIFEIYTLGKKTTRILGGRTILFEKSQGGTVANSSQNPKDNKRFTPKHNGTL